MIRKIAWETFKNTGDINAFMELKQIENIEKEMKGFVSYEKQSEQPITNEEARSLKSPQKELGHTPLIEKKEKPQQNL